jgi:predicted amidophosphoribosyltransferase
MAILTALSGFLRPPDCLACGAAGAWPCCSACLPPEPAGPGPWRLAADPSVTLWALGLYGDALRAAVLAGKLRGQAAALAALGRRLGALLLAAGVGADLVTWIAARPARGLPRDHAKQVASGVATALDLPLVDLLAPASGRDLGRARSRAGRGATLRPRSLSHGDPDADTNAGPDLGMTMDHHRAGQDPPGSKGRNRVERVPSRPPPRVRYRLAGGRVLLVDDVATTGGTLAGGVAALRRAGAREVEVAVLGASSGAFGPPASGSSSLVRPARRVPP